MTFYSKVAKITQPAGLPERNPKALQVLLQLFFWLLSIFAFLLEGLIISYYFCKRLGFGEGNVGKLDLWNLMKVCVIMLGLPFIMCSPVGIFLFLVHTCKLFKSIIGCDYEEDPNKFPFQVNDEIVESV